MYEDETQNYDPEIRNEYLIGLAYISHISSCHIIHSHVQSVAQLYLD